MEAQERNGLDLVGACGVCEGGFALRDAISPLATRSKEHKEPCKIPAATFSLRKTAFCQNSPCMNNI